MNNGQHPVVRMILTLTSLIRRHAPKTFYLSSAVGVLGGLANTASIAMIHMAVKGRETPPLNRIAIFLALCLAGQVMQAFAQYLLWRGCLRSTVNLVSNLTASILATPLRRLEEIGAARLLAALERDSTSLTDAVITVPLLLLNCTVLVGCACYLAWQSWIAAVVFIALVLVATASTLLVIGRSNGILTRARAQVDKLFEYFRSQSAGVKELKLNAARREQFLFGLRQTAEEACRLEVIVQTIYAATGGWFQLVFIIPLGFLVFVATNLFSLSVADVGAYALVLLYMTSTIGALSGQIQRLGQGTVAFSNLETLGLSLEKPIAPSDHVPERRTPPWSELELRDVRHSFSAVDGQPFVVGPVNLKIQRGEIVFITGGNGSGKTTLAKLLCGLYVPDEGAVCVDGIPVRSEAMIEAYRQKFSAVFWDFHVFKRLFGLNEEGATERARAWLPDLELQSKVDVVAGEFTTVELSQGQRKRLALLVGVLEDRDIYIFDEWAADQDRFFREHFYNRILPKLREEGKTVIVVSHDERYFGVADHVIKLEVGSLISDTRTLRAANAAAVEI
jgi:putative ATP-binding cassette transporter